MRAPKPGQSVAGFSGNTLVSVGFIESVTITDAVMVRIIQQLVSSWAPGDLLFPLGHHICNTSTRRSSCESFEQVCSAVSGGCEMFSAGVLCGRCGPSIPCALFRVGRFSSSSSHTLLGTAFAAIHGGCWCPMKSQSLGLCCLSTIICTSLVYLGAGIRDQPEPHSLVLGREVYRW